MREIHYDANPYEHLSEQEPRLCQKVEQRIGQICDIFSPMLEYAFLVSAEDERQSRLAAL